MTKISLGNLPCFICGHLVFDLSGQDDDWNTTLLNSGREQDQKALDENAFGPCHLRCLTRSEWGHFWSQRYLEKRGQRPDDVSFGGWHLLPGGDWTTTLLHDNGWKANLSHRAVRLAEPYADGMRMPVIQRRWERLQNHLAVFAAVEAAFARQQSFSLNAFLDALGILSFVDEPLALDRAGLYPWDTSVETTLAAAFCYDVWLPSELFEVLRQSVPEAPPGQDPLWWALEAASLPELAREAMSFPSVASVLAGGVSPDLPDEQGFTPLMFAATEGDIELARLLLACGADINFQDPDTQWTALHSAATQSNADMIRWLLDHGADPTVENEEGDTPLGMADFSGDEETVFVLQNWNG